MANDSDFPGLPPVESGANVSAPAEGQSTIQSETHTVSDSQQQDTPSVFPLPMLGVWALVFVGMWFIMIRPQRKREKALRELRESITVGDNIVTSGGLYGKVADVGEDCFIVEFGTNRGVRIPVNKSDVVAVKTPKMTPQASAE
jgi:preprotein translocase subunit YajC